MAAATRTGASYCALRLRAHDEDDVGADRARPRARSWSTWSGDLSTLGRGDPAAMSDPLEQEFDDFRPRRSRRARILLFVVLGVIVAFFLVTLFASLYTDRLWYSSVGYSGVYDTMLWTRVGLFFGFGLLMGGAVAGNMVIAYRARPFQPARLTGADRAGPLPRRRGADPHPAAGRPWPSVIGLFGGVAANGKWRTFLLWANRESVPHHRRVLPQGRRLLRLHPAVAALRGRLRDRGAGAVGAQRASSCTTCTAASASRPRPTGCRRPRRSSCRCSAGSRCWPRPSATTSTASTWSPARASVVTGMGYTDQHAVLPARNILVGVALICAVLFFVTAWRRIWLLPGVGISLLVVTSILLGLIWPAFVQHFQVNPNRAGQGGAVHRRRTSRRPRAGVRPELIELTRQHADARDRRDGAGPDRPDPVGPGRGPQPDLRAFEQIQAVYGYYTVPTVLDVDHYPIDGSDRALVLGARELRPERHQLQRPELVQPAHRLHPRQRA